MQTSRKTKTVLVICPFPLAIRNLINSGLASQIQRSLNATVAVVSPYPDEFFKSDQDTFKNFTVPSSGSIGGIPQLSEINLFEKALKSVHLTNFSIRYPDASLQNMELSARKGVSYFVAWITEQLFPDNSKRRKLLSSVVQEIAFSKPSISSIFTKLNPICIIVASPGHYWLDYHVIAESKKRSIPSICVILSWDNLYSRGPLCRRPDFLFVWSEEMKKQAIHVHRFESNHISIVGALQFRFYQDHPTQQQIFGVKRKLGLDPCESYIAYVCGARTSEYDVEDIIVLKSVLAKSKYLDLKIIVRPHPQGNKAAYARLKDYGIIVDDQLDVLNGDPCVFDKYSMEYMASFLSGSSFVISSWGTTALLEACIFQRPSIQLRWMDAVKHSNPTEVLMVKNFQRYIHMKAFDEEGGRLYSDHPSTISEIMDHLEKSKCHFETLRRMTVERIVHLPLGKVVERVVEAIDVQCLSKYNN
jgi:hypothetical protein